MARYCAGEPGAFHELYFDLAPQLSGYLTGLSGEKTLAEDLLQKTFMHLHRSRASYVRGADPTPWIYAIAHRTCVDEVRRRARNRPPAGPRGNPPHLGHETRERAFERSSLGSAVGVLRQRAHRGYLALRRLIGDGGSSAERHQET